MNSLIGNDPLIVAGNGAFASWASSSSARHAAITRVRIHYLLHHVAAMRLGRTSDKNLQGAKTNLQRRHLPILHHKNTFQGSILFISKNKQRTLTMAGGWSSLNLWTLSHPTATQGEENTNPRAEKISIQFSAGILESRLTKNHNLRCSAKTTSKLNRKYHKSTSWTLLQEHFHW